MLEESKLEDIPVEKETINTEKLNIWFGKDIQKDSNEAKVQPVGVPGQILEDETKAALLAKLRELDDGWEDNQKVQKDLKVLKIKFIEFNCFIKTRRTLMSPHLLEEKGNLEEKTVQQGKHKCN